MRLTSEPNLDEITFVPTTLRPFDHDCHSQRRKIAECLGASQFHDRTFTIWQCKECGLGFTDPIPTAESSALLYGDRESDDFQPDDSGLVAQLKHMAALRDVRSFCRGWKITPRATMLDFSCGNGAFASAIQSAFPGAQVYGSDTHLERPRGMTCSYLPNHDLDQHRNGFQFILCRHVLEHTYDPVQTVSFLRSLLVPGGVLVIEVPNLETPVRRMFGKYWNGYYAPFHTLHFTRNSLAAVVRDAGLTIAKEGGAEMPLIGRSLRNVVNCRYSLALFCIGAISQPIQVGIGVLSRKPVCLRVWAVNDRYAN